MMGTRAIVKAEGNPISDYHPDRFYSEDQIDFYLADIVEGRMAFTAEIASEGLKPEIVRAAEASFAINPRRQ
jgi:phosphoenolpyruvate carboxykinase (ATP)